MNVKKTMDVDHIKQLIMILKAEYGNKVIATEERARVWSVVLNHATYAEGELAIAELLSEARQFPPSVGEINQQILNNRQGEKVSWSDLWDQVMRAGQNSIYNAEEQASQLPEAARRAIGGAVGLKELGLASPSDLAVIRAQFRQRLESGSAASNDKETKRAILKALPNINVKVKEIG
jgi:hypothetical protein